VLGRRLEGQQGVEGVLRRKQAVVARVLVPAGLFHDLRELMGRQPTVDLHRAHRTRSHGTLAAAEGGKMSLSDLSRAVLIHPATTTTPWTLWKSAA
jgi:phytoene dehydrogenase-like protein